MEKKVLIYMLEDKLKPTGGPAGYVYNLRQELKRQEVENIFFRKGKENKEEYRDFYNHLPNKVKEFYRIMARNRSFKAEFSGGEHRADMDLNAYDYIHFHSTSHLFEVRDSLKDYKGKVILTSHTPKPNHLEIIEDAYTDYEKKRYVQERLGQLEAMDTYAFDHADYIVFPCEEAEEPYYNNWDAYKEIKARNKAKYRYLLTGTRACSPKLSREQVFEKYDIPYNAFVISFVGRHNETKGYDSLKRMGEKLLQENKDVYFLIAGKEEPLTGLTDAHWIEVGWTNDPHSIIAASDVFVLPNKDTYFDLVLLEVLSLGKPVVASFTGGNKYFKRINAEGIKLYQNETESMKLINEIKALSDEERRDLGQLNKELFEKEFSSEVFCKRYLQMIENLK